MKVTKQLTVEKEGDWVVASTPAPDRDHDRVMPAGINVSNFQKNPALFFGHNYSDPYALIGRVAEFSIGPEGMKFRPELRSPVNDADPMTIIKSLWDSNLLRAASIGFIPKASKQNELGGLDFNEIELLEISLVGLPANQEALRLSVKALDDKPAQAEPQTKAIEQPEPIAGVAIEQKRGRVLSGKNEQRLRGAYDAIGEVLSQLGEAEPAPDAQQEHTEPVEEVVITDERKDAVEGDESNGLDELANALGELVKSFK